MGLCLSAMPLHAHNYRRRTDLKGRTLVGGLFAFIWLMALPAWAVEYRLQVTNVGFLNFSSYMEKATPRWAQNEPMGRLEARLDTQQFSPAAVIPGREVQLLEDPAYGGTVPARISHLPATGRQAWTTYVFDGNPGDTVAFVVRSDMAAWQEVWFVAANPGGTLRRLSMAGPGIFGRFWQEVPEVSQEFLANAVDRGTFPQYVAQRAKAVDGMSLVVGEGHDTFYDPDRLYVLLKLPPEPHTFKVVVGWRDHDNRGNDD
jgi:hypothetical protein